MRPLSSTLAAPVAWTAPYLAFVQDLTADRVLRIEGPFNSATPESRAEWAWIQTAQRLIWQYGWGGGSAPASVLWPAGRLVT